MKPVRIFVLFLIVWNWVRKCWEKTFSPIEHLAVVLFSLLRSKRVLQNKTQKKIYIYFADKTFIHSVSHMQEYMFPWNCSYFFHRISYINVSIFFVSTDGKIKDLGEKIRRKNKVSFSRRIVFKYMCETDWINEFWQENSLFFHLCGFLVLFTKNEKISWNIFNSLGSLHAIFLFLILGKNILLEKYFFTRFRTWEPFLPLCVFFSPGEQKHEYPFLYSILQKMSCAGKKIPENFHLSLSFFFLRSKKEKKSRWNDFYLCRTKWKCVGRTKKKFIRQNFPNCL